MFRKPTSHTTRREVDRKTREPFSRRKNNLEKESLSLADCPPEQVHPHNAQPPKSLKVISHKKKTSDPVEAAKEFRTKTIERDLKASKELKEFRARTKQRSAVNPGS